MHKILLVEDDPVIRQQVGKMLDVYKRQGVPSSSVLISQM